MKSMLVCAPLLTGCGFAKPATLDAGACDLGKPFGPPVPVVELDTTQNEWTASPTVDGLAMFFSRDAPGGGNSVYVATRASVGEPFGAAAELAALNQAGSNTFIGGPSPDALALYLFSNRGGDYDLFVATRPSLAAPFAAPALVPVSAAGPDVDGFVSADQRTLYFTNLRAGTNDLYRAPLTGGTTGEPQVIGELATAGSEHSPVPSPDELTIYFTRDEKMYVAHRDAPSGTFGPAVELTELNAGALNRPRHVSPDGCTLLFVSSGYSAAGDVDILTATRPL